MKAFTLLFCFVFVPFHSFVCCTTLGLLSWWFVRSLRFFFLLLLASTFSLDYDLLVFIFLLFERITLRDWGVVFARLITAFHFTRSISLSPTRATPEKRKQTRGISEIEKEKHWKSKQRIVPDPHFLGLSFSIKKALWFRFIAIGHCFLPSVRYGTICMHRAYRISKQKKKNATRYGPPFWENTRLFTQRGNHNNQSIWNLSLPLHNRYSNSTMASYRVRAIIWHACHDPCTQFLSFFQKIFLKFSFPWFQSQIR